jgi:hypothetical protein
VWTGPVAPCPLAMKAWLRLVLVLGVCIGTLCLATASRAQEANTRQRAGELFKAGTTLAAQNRWREALSAFEQAALLVPHASTTYNIAYCERGLGHPTRARHFFRRALEENDEGGGLSQEQQTAAASHRAEAEKQIARVSVTVSPADARLTVDGRPLEIERTSPPVAVAGVRPLGAGATVPAAEFELWLDPGSHVFVIARGDGRKDTVSRVYGTAAEAALELVLPQTPKPNAAPPDVNPAPVPAPTAPSPSYWNGQRIGAVIVAVGAAGALATGVALGVRTANAWSEAQDACPGSVDCVDDTAFERSLDAKRDGNLATVALVTAGLATAGAVYLWVTAPDVAISVGPGRVAVIGAF